VCPTDDDIAIVHVVDREPENPVPDRLEVDMTRTSLPWRRTAPLPGFIPASLFPALGENGDMFATRADEIFRNFFGPQSDFAPAAWMPPVNVAEGKEEFTVTAELPGLVAKDVKIEFENNLLTIRGEKEEEKKEEEDKVHVYERTFGSFQRSLNFPAGIDEEKIAADFKHGVLTVRLPKSAVARATRKNIPIAGK
jgi:HSP20 family protein